MFKINWAEPISEYPGSPRSGITEEDCMVQIKRYLGQYYPAMTILIENRGVYVLDLTDIKMYHSSKSLKPLWRIGGGFSKTLIAEIVEAGDEIQESKET